MHTSVFERGTLRIEIEPDPPRLLLRLQGEIDYASAELLRAVPTDGWEAITAVIVDLSALTFSDTTGMDALLELQAAHRSCCREVRIVNACPLLRRLCSMLGEQTLLEA